MAFAKTVTEGVDASKGVVREDGGKATSVMVGRVVGVGVVTTVVVATLLAVSGV